MPIFNEYPSREILMSSLADLVAAQLATAIADKGKATLAVPGGTTPGPFLEALSNADLNWSKVKVMLTDERFVPESSDRSNTRLLRGTLFQNAAAAATMVPFYKEAETPEDVLDALVTDIKAALPLDVCVLGMGADMHTASLFPGADRLADGLNNNSNLTLLPMRAPGAPEPRLTLTAPALRKSTNIHILITGQEKRDALEQAQQDGPVEDAPIRAILSAPTIVSIQYAA